ncbi:MAG TPA: DUF4129 domain-containing protein [Ktedonosporobacter sp.]|nr:DUF4129 domain-containing protein [Ktedonosporobacter sp.]
MDTSPQPSPDEGQRVREALLRREQAIQDGNTLKVAAAPSWGERLLPLLFAAVETCWVDAILIGLASFASLQLDNLLMPLWAPFVLLAGGSWLLNFLERREAALSNQRASEAGPAAIAGSSLFYMLMGATILFIIWASIYSTAAFVIDPRWLLMLLNDILLLSPQAYHVLGIIVVSVFLCWWGLRIGRYEVEPGNVFNRLRLGMGIILLVIILRLGALTGTLAGLAMLLLMPIFLALALVTHSLARAVFMRKAHPGGLQGSVALQERAVLWVVGTLGVLLLLFAFTVGTLTSMAFLIQVKQLLNPLGQLYDAFAVAFAQVIVWILTPLFWLLQQIHIKTPSIRIPTPPPACKLPHGCRVPQTPPPFIMATAGVLKVLIPILVIALIIFLVWLALRRRRVALARIERRFEELHESLWSWNLFWAQVKGLLLALWRRFFPQPAIAAAAENVEEIGGEPGARSIREIYRALLAWAAGRGHARKKDETPYEFKVRLDEHLPQAEPELSSVTQAYTAIRYGAIVPDEAEVARVQGNWMELQRKGQQP